MFTHDPMNFDEAKLFGTYEASQSVNWVGAQQSPLKGLF